MNSRNPAVIIYMEPSSATEDDGCPGNAESSPVAGRLPLDRARRPQSAFTIDIEPHNAPGLECDKRHRWFHAAPVENQATLFQLCFQPLETAGSAQEWINAFL